MRWWPPIATPGWRSKPERSSLARMKRAIALPILLCLLAFGAVSGMAQGRRGGMMMRPRANPSALVAADLSFARQAREQGQWSAFRAAAAPEAALFVPQRVRALDWLKNRANPPVALAWQVQNVWASCDGAFAVTRGAWQKSGQEPRQKSGTSGYYITLWQRQNDGSYKWLIDHAEPLGQPLAEPEMISAKVADCPQPRAAADQPPPSPPGANQRLPATNQRSRGRNGPPLPPPVNPMSGRAPDGSLAWSAHADASGLRGFSLSLQLDGTMREVLHLAFTPAQGG